jgi:hypothetical protein
MEERNKKRAGIMHIKNIDSGQGEENFFSSNMNEK